MKKYDAEINDLAGDQNGFIDANGQSVRRHDHVEHFTGRQGTLRSSTQDGDAFVLFDGDTRITPVRWRSICKVLDGSELPADQPNNDKRIQDLEQAVADLTNKFDLLYRALTASHEYHIDSLRTITRFEGR